MCKTCEKTEQILRRSFGKKLCNLVENLKPYISMWKSNNLLAIFTKTNPQAILTTQQRQAFEFSTISTTLTVTTTLNKGVI